MRRLLLPLLTAALVLAMSATAYAVTMTIGEAGNAPAGTVVTVSGEVTKADGNEYTISDGVDNLSVDFGPTWFKALDLAVGDAVTIEGEMDRGKDGAKAAEVDGFSVTKADGTVETVRAGSGRPPWAGRGGPKGKASPEAPDAADDCTDSD